jgi:hypothetical protein
MWRLSSISSASKPSRARRYSWLSFGKRTVFFFASSLAGVSAAVADMIFSFNGETLTGRSARPRSDKAGIIFCGAGAAAITDLNVSKQCRH